MMYLIPTCSYDDVTKSIIRGMTLTLVNVTVPRVYRGQSLTNF